MYSARRNSRITPVAWPFFSVTPSATKIPLADHPHGRIDPRYRRFFSQKSNSARTSGSVCRADAQTCSKKATANGANGEEQRDHIEPDEAALLIFVVDD